MLSNSTVLRPFDGFKSYPTNVMYISEYYKALREGKLLRPSNCEQCGRLCKPDGHHTDYLQPLKVVWLCPDCHARSGKAKNSTKYLKNKIETTKSDSPKDEFRQSFSKLDYEEAICKNSFTHRIRIRTKNGDLLKLCSKCNRWKSEAKYSKDILSKDGLQILCKACFVAPK